MCKDESKECKDLSCALSQLPTIIHTCLNIQPILNLWPSPKLLSPVIIVNDDQHY